MLRNKTTTNNYEVAYINTYSAFSLIVSACCTLAAGYRIAAVLRQVVTAPFAMEDPTECLQPSAATILFP